MIKQFKTNHLRILFLFVLVAFVGCNQEKTKEEKPMETNVLLKDWTGPYGGVPAFDKMKVEDVKSAMMRGMELNLEEIDAIANNEEAPNFENTIEEMERSGKALDNGFTYYGIFSSNMSTPEFREVQRELAPLFSE
ncbi:MAG: M3 family peptidase, partial [Lutimonas sp.]